MDTAQTRLFVVYYDLVFSNAVVMLVVNGHIVDFKFSFFGFDAYNLRYLSIQCQKAVANSKMLCRNPSAFAKIEYCHHPSE